MVLMYTVSAAITLAGGILVAHDRRNKAFLGLLGCGMGAWYLSLFLSDFYFHAINDGILLSGTAGVGGGSVCAVTSAVESLPYHRADWCGHLIDSRRAHV